MNEHVILPQILCIYSCTNKNACVMRLSRFTPLNAQQGQNGRPDVSLWRFFRAINGSCGWRMNAGCRVSREANPPRRTTTPRARDHRGTRTPRSLTAPWRTGPSPVWKRDLYGALGAGTELQRVRKMWGRGQRYRAIWRGLPVGRLTIPVLNLWCPLLKDLAWQAQ